MSIDQLLADKQVTLRDFGLLFARLIAGMAVDPHGYFEKKYTARIERARTDTEIIGLLAQLVQWATSSALNDTERQRLDNELTEQGLPVVAELRSHLLP